MSSAISDTSTSDSHARVGAPVVGAERSRRRFEWIDHARGLGMILVVVGHAMSYGFASSFAYAFIFGFHMPLFFLISGMVRAGARERPLWHQARQLARSLLLPFLFFGTVAIVMHLVIAWGTTRQMPSASDIVQAFVMTAYGSALTIPVDPPLWFLPSLFLTTLGSDALIRAIRWQAALIVTVAVALGIMVFPPAVRLPWSADTAVVSAVFFQVGLRLQPGRTVPADGAAALSAGWTALLAALAFGATAIVVSFNQQVDMSLLQFGNPALFFAGACFGAIGTFLLARLLPGKATLQLLADDARVIFPMHVLVFGMLTGILTGVLHVPKDSFRADLLTVAVYTVTAIVVCVAAASILRAVAPRAIGEAIR